VVFNAHYLTWCDVASSGWAAAAAGWTGVGDPVDWMVVRAVIDWYSSAAYGDVVDIDCGVSRWGNRSFDATYRGTVDGRPVFEAAITYVTIDPGTKTSVPVPDALRSGLGPRPV
jgi:acyl-CoA thioester hydrolase